MLNSVRQRSRQKTDHCAAVASALYLSMQQSAATQRSAAGVPPMGCASRRCTMTCHGEAPWMVSPVCDVASAVCAQ